MSYPEIAKGLGQLTPDMWSRIMTMLKWFEMSPDGVNLSALASKVTTLENTSPFFFARLLRAAVFDTSLQNSNCFKYAWVKCEPSTTALPTAPNPVNQLQGLFSWADTTSLSSWGTNTYLPDATAPVTTPYTHAATNMMETYNTGNYTAPGIDESGGLGDFMLQAIGGGDTVNDTVTPNVTQVEWILKSTPIVPMFMYPDSGGTLRYMFLASNTYDGNCNICS